MFDVCLKFKIYYFGVSVAIIVLLLIGALSSKIVIFVMFTSARRFASNTLAGASTTNGNYGSNVNLIASCYIRKLTRTTNGSGGGLKAVVTTALLFIMGALYCLYSSVSSTGGAVTTVTFGHQSLGMYVGCKIIFNIITVLHNLSHHFDNFLQV